MSLDDFPLGTRVRINISKGRGMDWNGLVGTVIHHSSSGANGPSGIVEVAIPEEDFEALGCPVKHHAQGRSGLRMWTRDLVHVIDVPAFASVDEAEAWLDEFGPLNS